MFPVTVNGNTYNEADFQGSDAARNFGKFAYDLVQDKVNVNSAASTVATSTSSSTYATGAKTFTIAAGKGFKKGMPVSVTRVGDVELSAMYGVVTNYVGTTLSITIETVNAPDSSSSTPWVISSCLPVVPLTGTVSTGFGGTGAVTAEAAWEALPLPKYDARPEHMNDMEGGPLIDVSNLTTSLIAPVGHNKLLIYTKGGGRVRNGVEAEAYAEGVPDLHRHPGIMELSVKNLNSEAALLGGDNGFVQGFTTTGGILMEVGIYIPEIPILSAAEQFSLWVGLEGGTDRYASSFFSLKSSLPQSGTAVLILNEKARGRDASYYIKTNVASESTTFNWPRTPGWMTVSLTLNATTLGAVVRKDGEVHVSLSTGVGANGLTNDRLMTPMIVLRKISGGTKTFKVYVDYWYLGLRTDASPLAR